MPSKHPSKKRQRDKKAKEEELRTSHPSKAPKLPKGIAQNRLNQEEDFRLTRKRSQALGREPTAPPEEPERLLRHKRKQTIKDVKEERATMAQRPSSGGRPPRAQENEHDDEARHNTLQGLLRRLGAGFEDAFPGMGMMGGGARIKQILAMLRDEDDDQHMLGLNELCEYISICTEDSMISFPTEQIVPLLVNFLSHEHNPDVMLLAARALTFLADVFPPACTSIIRHEAVPAFCARLLTIEYIDLAEQSLQALEKLSHEHPGSLLRAGALVAVLSYIDFFQTGVQRVAVSTAANLCRGLSGGDYTDAVQTAAPLLIGLLNYTDAKIVDSACLALTRIADAYSRSPEKMEMLVGFGLINSIVEMLAVNEVGSITSQLSSSTFYGLVKLLATCASNSHLVSEKLLQAGVSTTVKNLLASTPLLAATGASPANALRSADQLQDLVALASQLLPSVPDASVAMLAEPVPSMSDLTGEQGTETKGGEASALACYLRENPASGDQVANDLFPVMMKVHASGVTPQIKRQSLVVLQKVLHHTRSETLQTLLADHAISSLIANLLRSTDDATVAQGMQMADTLMVKLPDIFCKFFLKEGVVHAMEELAAAAPESTEKASGGVHTRRRSGGKDEGKQAAKASAVGERTPAGTLRRAVSSHARRFCDRYFTDAKGKPIGCHTEGVKNLEKICARLPQLKAVKDLLRTLAATGDKGVSTFEILSSGTVRTLRSYLQGDDLPSDIQGEERKWMLLERLGEFANAALPLGSGGSPPLYLLVEKLQKALSSTEKFKTRLTSVSPIPSHPFLSGYYPGNSSLSRSGNASGSLSAGLAALSNPFKIRLVKAQGETSLKDYGHNVVLIEPLASMAQIEEFLWERVQVVRGGAGRDQSQRGGPSEGSEPPKRGRGGAQPAEDNASNKATEQPARERTQSRPIPQSGRRLTRAQARAAAEAEVAAQGQEEDVDPMMHDPLQSGGRGEERVVEGPPPEIFHSDSDGEYDDAEDEDMEDAYVDGGDNDYDDEDDMLEAAVGVHDMHLEEGQPSSGPPSQAAGHPGRSGHPRSSRPNRSATASGLIDSGNTNRSYAGAAATNARNEPQEAGSRLAFYANGHLLDPETTIFQAVQSVSAANASSSTSNIGSRVWSEVHTLTYRVYADAIHERDIAAAAAAAGTSAAVETPQATDVEDREQSSKGPFGALFLVKSPLEELIHPPVVLQGASDKLEGASIDCLDVISVLASLEAVNRLAPHLQAALEARKGHIRASSAPIPGHVPRDMFISGRLGPKMAQQLKDVISICGGALPAWCSTLAINARFLFPFEVRRRLFYCTAFGLSRALLYLQQAHAVDHGPDGAADRTSSSLRIGRVQRQKVRISRRRLLESSHRVFEMYAGPKSQLEVEFFNEAGSGLGPTLEFYTLLSHELQRRSLHMWRDENADNNGENRSGEDEKVVPTQIIRTVSGPGPLRGELFAPAAGIEGPGEEKDLDPSELVSAPMGLFPCPLSPGMARANAKNDVYKHFRLLGNVVAKALQDSRLLDLPLNPVFYRLALGGRVDVFDVRAVDPALGATLERLHAAEHLAEMNGTPPIIDGCPVEDLCLTFVLPGYPKYELRPNGTDIQVTSENLRDYIDAVVDATIGSGVASQIEAFRAGFSAIFPLSNLNVFYEDEIEAMLCGTGEMWTIEGLAAVIKFDHGYTANSAPIQALLAVLTELDAVDQRRFLRFVTGTPRLPAGGLAALQPRLTVVRKLSSAGAGAELGTSIPPESLQSNPNGAGMVGIMGMNPADGDLPSVMTCANYLKLPPYSSKEVLKERLLFAIREGQGSFDLS